MTTIGRELIGRGHQFTVFNIPDVEPLARSEGAGFCQLGAATRPPGSFHRFTAKLATLKGLPAMRFGLSIVVDEIQMLLGEAPAAMRARGVDALLVDQGQPAGSSLAEHLNIPFFTICNAIAADFDPSVPPALTPWRYSTHWAARLRNHVAHFGLQKAFAPAYRIINRFRQEHGLPPIRTFADTFSPLAEISQQTADFDFPNPSLPPQFHYIGLLRRTASAGAAFPFDRLDGRPLVYSTLGTIHADSGGGVIQNLAAACHDLNAQLALALGGNGDLSAFADLPGHPIVVHNAPQLAVLERASVTFCHGGINTVLESLVAEAPVLAMPIFVDQFGCGARLARTGAGAIAPANPTREQLRSGLEALLREPSYRERAKALRLSIERAGGERRAADIIEERLPKSGV